MILPILTVVSIVEYNIYVMKGKILRNILELLENGAMNQVNFFDSVLSSGYGASMSKIDYHYQKNKEKYYSKKSKSSNLEEKRKRLQKYFSKLKNDGLSKPSQPYMKILMLSRIGFGLFFPSSGSSLLALPVIF